jgi:branched-chain amino acid transport system ATP-binding protein
VTLLEIKGLSAGYGPLRVLHDLDMTLESGERVGLVGLNGHGKSTLLQAIVGLTGWQSGSILLDGNEIGGRRMHGAGRTTPKIVRKGVALAPQGDAIFPGLTVRQNLDSGAFSARAWRERRKRREGILEIFPPLAKLLDQSVGTLSGGERRMVSLGRAFMGDPRIFLVDEPSLGLAPIISRAVIEALGKIDIGDGAMIIAEQDLGLIHGRVDRMLGMHAGELKQDIGDALMVGHPEQAATLASEIEL